MITGTKSRHRRCRRCRPALAPRRHRHRLALLVHRLRRHRHLVAGAYV
jgi:hypothetical protein